MNRFLQDNFEHILCGLILLARIGDIGTTWLATPNLRLEANPMVRKLRWPFALATLLFCLLPYWNTAVAWSALILFLLVCAQNAQRIWLVRGLGEDRYYEVVLSAARNSRVGSALASQFASSFFLLLTASLVVLASGGASAWGFWTGIGIGLFAVANLVYGSVFIRRVFIEAG